MSHLLHPDATLETLNARIPGTLCGWYGIQIDAVSEGRMHLTMQIRPEMLAPNGFLHAASVVALADTGAGMAAFAHLPVGASGFTTVELKINFMATQIEGRLTCKVTAAHTGRTTQIWDAEIFGETGKRLALFRCTQMILWPKAG